VVGLVPVLVEQALNNNHLEQSTTPGPKFLVTCVIFSHVLMY
jgi:hypothetical protein